MVFLIINVSYYKYTQFQHEWSTIDEQHGIIQAYTWNSAGPQSFDIRTDVGISEALTLQTEIWEKQRYSQMYIKWCILKYGLTSSCIQLPETRVNLPKTHPKQLQWPPESKYLKNKHSSVVID